MFIPMSKLLWITIFCLMITSTVIECKKKKAKKVDIPTETMISKPVLPDPPSPQGVTYDGRSMIIHGKRELLFSGSIHYPRSTPEVLIHYYSLISSSSSFLYSIIMIHVSICLFVADVARSHQ